MNSIVPLGTNALVARETRRALSITKGEAVVRAARVEAQTYLTGVAIQSVTLVAALEEEAIKRAPLAEPRLKAIADVHAGVVASEILRPW